MNDLRCRRAPTIVSRDPAIVTARILDAAQAEFAKHGYVAASTNRIRLAFGGSKATLFRHYPTKLQMLEGVILRIAADWRRGIDWRDVPDQVPAEWLAIVSKRMLEWFLSDGPQFVGRLGIAEGRYFPQLKRIFDRTAGRPLRARLAAQFRAWHRRRLLRSGDAHGDAVHFLDLVISGPVSRKLYGGGPMSRRDIDAHVARCVELFLRGCGR